MSAQRVTLKSFGYTVLLMAAIGGIMVLRREEGIPSLHRLPNLPEDLTEAVKQAVSSSGNAELERFYEHAAWQPVWRERRDEVLAALRDAGSRGLNPADYEPAAANDPAGTDVAISAAMLRYAHDLRYGRFNPGIYEPGIYEKESAPPADLAWPVAQDPGGVETGLRKLDPPFEEYRALVQALPSAAGADRLAAERALERWRWLPRAYDRGAILVNVPEFQVRAYDSSLQPVLQMRAVVGLPRNPTPLFTAELKYLVFGPYWNVPRSILQNEIIPDVEKNRAYLEKNNYEVMSGAKVVSSGEVSDEVLEGLKSGEYSVRQVPGGRNALGRVKFMFPNNNNVYLHDTNARNLFSREARALSHGCVRVDKPQELAEWLLRGEEAWPKDRIAQALKQTKSQQANLKDTIPVFMVYHAATVNPDGSIHVWRDIYKQDEKLAAQMGQPATSAVPAPRPRE